MSASKYGSSANPVTDRFTSVQTGVNLFISGIFEIPVVTVFSCQLAAKYAKNFPGLLMILSPIAGLDRFLDNPGSKITESFLVLADG